MDQSIQSRLAQMKEQADLLQAREKALQEQQQQLGSTMLERWETLTTNVIKPGLRIVMEELGKGGVGHKSFSDPHPSAHGLQVKVIATLPGEEKATTVLINGTNGTQGMTQFTFQRNGSNLRGTYGFQEPEKFAELVLKVMVGLH